MGRKIELRLLSSGLMTEKGEDEFIRFPLKARERFGFSDSRVVIGRGKGEKQLSLFPKKAYRADIQRLARMIMAGKISEEEATCVGFVSKNVQQQISGGDESIWLTEGIESITIGCDPEFGLVDASGVLQKGASVLPDSLHAEFGADGPGVEVRPAPSRSHVSLVHTIKGILDKPPAQADKYHWRGGATFRDKNRVYWFGGHIHLGRPNFVPEDFAHPCYEKIATALDSLLALPMVSFDTPEPFLRRSGCTHSYGKAGDIRDDYPEGDRFEYRVLSGLWLVHPTLAKIALGVAKCVAETAYSRISTQNCDPDWIMAPASKAGLLKSFALKGTREKAAIINKAQPARLDPELLNEWETQLHSLERRDEYKEEITALIELTKSSPEDVVPRINLDVRAGWQENKPLLPGVTTGPLRRALDAVEEKE
jgi:hypothetical protein